MRLWEIAEGEPKSKLLRFIMENCQPWFRELGGIQKPVYRGVSFAKYKQVNKNPSKHMVVSVRKDRRPLDSSEFKHESFQTLLNTIGAKANRENSSFVTGHHALADGFGSGVVVAMPVGDFNYTWSTEHRDWTTSFLAPFMLYTHEEADAYDSWTDGDYKRWKWGQPIEDLNVEAVRDAARGIIRFDDGSLLEAIQSGHEIMIHAGRMLYIDLDFYRGLLHGMIKEQLGQE